MSVTDKYMEVVFADDTNPNAIKKPAKAWRNWWLTDTEFRHTLTGELIGPGVWEGRYRYPSKEIAEQKAADWVASNFTNHGWSSKWLGAFPEGERP